MSAYGLSGTAGSTCTPNIDEEQMLVAFLKTLTDGYSLPEK